MNKLKNLLLHSSIKRPLQFFVLLILLALLAPILANNKPILSIDKGAHFPIFHSQPYESSLDAFEVWPLIRYHSSSIDFNNLGLHGPFDQQKVSSWQQRHWLGTDALGRDVLAGLIYGARTALLIGFGSMLLACLIGVLMGGIAAYFQDSKFQIELKSLISIGFPFLLFILISAVAIPWSLSEIPFSSKLSTLFLLFLAFSLLVLFLQLLSKKMKQAFFTRKIKVPVDLIIGRIIEVFEAIPLLYIIVALSAFLPSNYFTIVLLLGFTGWTSVAKFFRSEVLKISNLGYIENSKALGLKTQRIFLKHLLPNAIEPVLISFSFGVAGAILIEATLSFLGMGLGDEFLSWGNLLAASRENYQAWWLAVFPGLAIFCTVLSLNLIADYISNVYSGYSTRT